MYSLQPQLAPQAKRPKLSRSTSLCRFGKTEVSSRREKVSVKTPLETIDETSETSTGSLDITIPGVTKNKTYSEIAAQCEEYDIVSELNTIANGLLGKFLCFVVVCYAILWVLIQNFFS